MMSWGPGFCPLFRAAVAHHGRPVSSSSAVRDPRIWQPYLTHDPLIAAREIGGFIQRNFPLAFGSTERLIAPPALQHHFAGLVALADQIGSREDRFPLGRSITPETLAKCRDAASGLMQDLRLDTSRIRSRWKSRRPADMFGWPAAAEPKPMQAALRDFPTHHRLVVLESETGSGKTEAAIMRFQRLFEAGEVDALYFAVPTRAAASGLHRRIDRAFRSLAGEAAVLALPGYLKVGDVEGKALPNWRVAWDDDPDAAAQAARWAAESPRRYLAAFAAIGTVDQAMLAGLKVKWAHFRSAVLARALLVVDEVHASDRYMQAVLAGVIRTHLACGGHALLMSATLGSAARASWLGGQRARPSPNAPYPALSWWEADREHSQALAHDGREKDVVIHVEPLIDEHAMVAERVLAAARQGARVLVVRNTVRQAVAVYRAILALDAAAPVLRVAGIPAPHHGRFATEDRRLLDAAVEASFGKHAPAAAAIAVGTQTLEQSLDLCADYLITDLCPIDVLLQRIGRLHRHSRPRPEGFAPARCLVLTPDALAPDGRHRRFGLGAGPDGHGVYPDIVGLQATWLLILERPEWSIPRDNRALVEDATDPKTLAALAARLGPQWTRARGDVLGRGAAQGQQGRLNLIDRSLGFDGRCELFPDDASILTRLGGDRYLLTLPEGTTGPFGQRITQLALPGHLLRGNLAEAELAVTVAEDGLLLTLGDTRLRYGVSGVEPDD
jgi:CRISPR-associated endonuclease/helicase Cas3